MNYKWRENYEEIINKKKDSLCDFGYDDVGDYVYFYNVGNGGGRKLHTFKIELQMGGKSWSRSM